MFSVVSFLDGGDDKSTSSATIVGLAVSMGAVMHEEIRAFNASQTTEDGEICEILAAEIDRCLAKAESKIWHRHPVWFIDGNPIVGYSKLKSCVRLLFGQNSQ